MDHNVGQRDFFDPAPFLLHHHDVVHADGVGEGKLDAGKDVDEGGLHGEPGHDGEQPGRRQDAGAKGADVGEGEQRDAEGHDDDQGDADPPRENHLTAEPPGSAVIGHVHAVVREHERLNDHQDGHSQPGNGSDECDQQGMVHIPAPRGVLRGQRQGDPDADQAQGQAKRNARHPGRFVERGEPSVEPDEDAAEEPGEDESSGHGNGDCDNGHCLV